MIGCGVGAAWAWVGCACGTAVTLFVGGFAGRWCGLGDGRGFGFGTAAQDSGVSTAAVHENHARLHVDATTSADYVPHHAVRKRSLNVDVHCCIQWMC